MTRTHILGGLGLSLAVLLLAGCGADRPDESVPQDHPWQQATSSGLAPAKISAAPAATPLSAGNDPLAAPDQLASGADEAVKNAGGTLATGTGDTLANDPAIPTAYRHWLTVSQYAAQVRLRVNGIQQGGDWASTTTDITMLMHPGSNAITLEYAPQAADAWARVYVTLDPPLPQRTLFDSAALPSKSMAGGQTPSDTKPKPITKTFTILVR